MQKGENRGGGVLRGGGVGPLLSYMQADWWAMQVLGEGSIKCKGGGGTGKKEERRKVPMQKVRGFDGGIQKKNGSMARKEVGGKPIRG